MKLIVLPLHNRVELTRLMFEHLAVCDGVGEYTILASLNPHPASYYQLIRLVKSQTFADIRLHVWPRDVGYKRNGWWLTTEGFKLSDFMVGVLDDMLLSRDALRLMEHCDREYRNSTEVFSASTYSRESPGPEHWHTLVRTNQFCSLGATGWWRHKTLEYCGGELDFDKHFKDQYAPLEDVALWKWMHDTPRYTVYPLLSRNQNIGRVSTIHFPAETPEWYDQNHTTPMWANHFLVPQAPFHEAR